MKNIEVEIQVNVENIAPLLEFVKDKAKFVSKERELDQYFTPAHRNFAEKFPVDEWLRLRDADGKCSINYKFWHKGPDGKTTHCTEHQTGINDAEQMEQILTVLDFTPVVKVDKIREKYHYQDYEIAIDKVAGLDQTVEVEYKGQTEKAPADIVKEMVKFLQDLGVGKMKRSYQGYAFLLLYPEKAEYETIE